MIAFKFNSNISNVNKRMSNMVARQLPYATSRALNETGKKLVKYNRIKMKKTFENANAYTLNAFYFKPAKKGDLSITVRRKGKPSGKHYLEVQDAGGKRPQKGVERMLSQRLPTNEIVTAVLPTTRTGGSKNNILMSQVNKVLGGVGQSYIGSAKQRARDPQQAAGSRYFVKGKGFRGAKSAGIYQVNGKGKPQKLFHILDYLPDYRKKTDFHGDMNRISRINYPKELQKWLRQAMRTAKL